MGAVGRVFRELNLNRTAETGLDNPHLYLTPERPKKSQIFFRMVYFFSHHGTNTPQHPYPRALRVGEDH